MSKSDGKIGAGMSGSCFSPPLACKNKEVEKVIEHIGRDGLVMKYTSLSFGLTAIRTGQVIRDRWTKLGKLSKMDGDLSFAWKQLLSRAKTSSPDDFYVLPLTQVCSECEIPPNVQITKPPLSVPKPVFVGIYMKNGGKTWKDAVPGSAANQPVTIHALKMFRHLVTGILLLHKMDITHNDIRRANILVDNNNIPRLIDWELRHVNRRNKPKGNRDKQKGKRHVEFYVDEMPDDLRKFVSVDHGFWSSTADLIKRDWLKCARILTKSWPEKALAAMQTNESAVALKTIQTLRLGSDDHALLTLSILPK